MGVSPFVYCFCIKNASTIGGTPIIVNVNQNLGHYRGKIRPPFHKKSVIICLLGKSLLKPVAFTIDVQNVRIMGQAVKQGGCHLLIA